MIVTGMHRLIHYLSLRELVSGFNRLVDTNYSTLYRKVQKDGYHHKKYLKSSVEHTRSDHTTPHGYPLTPRLHLVHTMEPYDIHTTNEIHVREVSLLDSGNKEPLAILAPTGTTCLTSVGVRSYAMGSLCNAWCQSLSHYDATNDNKLGQRVLD